MIFSVLIAVIVAAALVVLIMLLRGVKRKAKDEDVSQKIQKKGKSAIIKNAEKKLAHDPHDVQSLEMLGDIYYNEKTWDKTWNIYKTLFDISSAHTEIDIAKCSLRMGIAALNLGKMEDAIKSLMYSLKKNTESFDCNFYLGQALFKNGTYDKAVFCLRKARLLQPENLEVNALLGQSLFKNSKYRESLPYFKKVLDENPDNKELLYDMAIAMEETGMTEKALKVFMHLRPDPNFGPQSCLEAGKIHERNKNYNEAVKDYGIALKLQNVPPQILIQIKYRLANTFIQLHDISKGLALLKQIQVSKPGYKDVEQLISRYAELNQNKNLQTYILSGTTDFIALCRKLITTFHKDSFVKFEDIQIASESVEITCAVENSKWEAKQIFRFYRTQNVIGDIYIREFHGKIRDTKCDQGYCVTLGSFSESAHKYTEGRPVDLVEKDELVKILKKIND